MCTFALWQCVIFLLCFALKKDYQAKTKLFCWFFLPYNYSWNSVSSFNAWLKSPLNTESLSSIICLVIVSALFPTISPYGILSFPSWGCCLSRDLFVFPLLFSSSISILTVLFPYLILQHGESEFAGNSLLLQSTYYPSTCLKIINFLSSKIEAVWYWNFKLSH